MTERTPNDDRSPVPDVTGFPGGSGPGSAIRRPRRANRAPLAALGVAVLLGAGLAWGVVAMIPDSWKLRGKRGPDVSKTTDEAGPPKRDADDPDAAGRSADVPGGTVPVIPLRTGETRHSSSASTRDLDSELNRRTEKRAAELLSEARGLLSRRQTKQAVRVLEDLRNRYPGTRAAGDAEKLLLAID